MTKKEFASWAQNTLIYLDGATGSNLVLAGMPAGVCPEKWILEHPDVCIRLQREYAEAGSNIVYSPTFTANRVKLQEYGLQDDMEDMITQLIALSRKAVGDNIYIAGDLTMTGQQLAPLGTMQLEELISIYKEQIGFLAAAGADLLVVETMMSLQEARAALIAAGETCDLPVLVTLTFEADGRTLYGTDAASAAVTLEALGASAVGVNCSAGPDKLVSVVRTMAEVAGIPIIAKPNAGLPYADKNGNTCYDMPAETFAASMQALIEAGASIIGGCCGTTPVYIRQLKELSGTVRTKMPSDVHSIPGRRVLCSERKTISFGTDNHFIMIGERINPTGKKKLQANLREGSLDMVLQFAEEQEKAGAEILDINMGMSGVDEKALMLQVLSGVGMTTSLPLSIDSSHIDVIEAALRHYPGRALINSISLEQEKCDRLLLLAKKYGAMFILLPLSDKGLPANLEEKKAIIDEICRRALKLGLRTEDIVVDSLVNTVGANKEAALQAMQTIRYCKERRLATVCGLSNISFGLPERGYVNTAFLTMAIAEGLTMAIVNPCQEMLTACAFASDLLLNKENSDIRYISHMASLKTDAPAAPSAPVIPDTGSVLTELSDAVLKGNRKTISEITKRAIETGEQAKKLLDEVLLPAINQVGDLFDKGKYFLPQLIASAEAMKLAIEILEPLLLTGREEGDMPVVVIATVEGDIHDIGKNLVALMLKNYGFKVIDLGKDVPKEKIIEEALRNNARIIALSALMTTTMKQMQAVIQYAREQGVTARIMIGGAVITQEYADEIGADGYSQDAAGAVRLAKRLLGMLHKASE